MDPRQRLHVVVIDRSDSGADELLAVLRQGGYAISGAVVDNPAALAEALRERPWDLVLATQRVPGFGIPRALTVLRTTHRDLPLVGVAPARREGEGVALLALGARDVVDPTNRDHLLAVVRREVASLEDRRRLRRLERLHGLRSDRPPRGGPAGTEAPHRLAGAEGGSAEGNGWAELPGSGEAGRDYLTGLPDRGYFLEALTRYLDRPPRERTGGHLVLVELENFRALRQSGGIATCDAIMAELAEVMRREVPPGRLFARFGDHSFAILTPDEDAARVEQGAERVRGAIKATVTEVGGQFFATTASLGIAAVTPGVSDLRVVLSRADQACRRAILAGGNQVRRFEASAGDGVGSLRRTVAPDVVWSALGDDRLALWYQPLIPLHGRPKPFYQTQLRMLDRQGNPFPLDAFECMGSDGELAMKLDFWVVERALAEAQAQRAAGIEPTLLIRLSDSAIESEAVPLHLSRMLQRTQLDGGQFVFEVREAAARRQVRFAQAFVSALQRLGCAAAIADDAGPRTSGLSLVHHVDARYVRLGSGFVEGLARNEQRRVALRAFQDNARRLERVTIASGIEEASGLAVLWHCGVDYAQGDYIQEPRPGLEYDFEASLA